MHPPAHVPSPFFSVVCAPSTDSSIHFTTQATIFDYTVKDAEGNDVPLRKFEDKKALLLVNVASR